MYDKTLCESLRGLKRYVLVGEGVRRRLPGDDWSDECLSLSFVVDVRSQTYQWVKCKHPLSHWERDVLGGFRPLNSCTLITQDHEDGNEVEEYLSKFYGMIGTSYPDCQSIVFCVNMNPLFFCRWHEQYLAWQEESMFDYDTCYATTSGLVLAPPPRYNYWRREKTVRDILGWWGSPLKIAWWEKGSHGPPRSF